jgi:hypothetical protein
MNKVVFDANSYFQPINVKLRVNAFHFKRFRFHRKIGERLNVRVLCVLEIPTAICSKQLSLDLSTAICALKKIFDEVQSYNPVVAICFCDVFLS